MKSCLKCKNRAGRHRGTGPCHQCIQDLVPYTMYERETPKARRRRERHG
jgi:hypothetical protein